MVQGKADRRRRWSNLFVIAAFFLAVQPASTRAADWFAGPEGKASAAGTKQSPWNLETALGGQKPVAPGDTVWLLPGTYRHPDRRLGSPGYVVRLAGEEAKPVQVRAVPGARATVDGGLSVVQPAGWLWIRDLEILVSENFTMSRTLSEPGSHPKSYDRPWGGLNVNAGKGCKYIHLVIHDCAQGVSFWTPATDSDLYGCILYDNGWKAPDRGHGHAVYTQNKDGVKTIDNCIMTGSYGYTMHAYGSSRADVDNYLVQRNICYRAGTFLIGGGKPSRNIRVLGNSLYGVAVQLGYSAPYNEDCEVRDNLIVDGGLSINKYRRVVNENNRVIARGAARPQQPATILVQPSLYDPGRAHVAIFNWTKAPSVAIDISLLRAFAKPGDTLRWIDPRDFYGKPVATVTLQDKPVQLPVEGEFAAFVLLRQP